MAPFDGKYMTSYFMIIIISALSLPVYEIFANKKSQKFDFEIKAKVKEEKREFCH